MLLPQELKNHKFHRAVSGYAASEVDEYIDFIVSKYETLYRENDELERKLAIALKSLDELRTREKQVAELEKVLKGTIAQASADAEAKKAEIIRAAVAEADRVTAEAEAYVAAQEKVLRQLQNEVAALRDTLFAAYSEHIDRIEQLTAIAAGDFRPAEEETPADLDEVGEEILPEENEVITVEEASEADEDIAADDGADVFEKTEVFKKAEAHGDAEVFEEPVVFEETRVFEKTEGFEEPDDYEQIGFGEDGSDHEIPAESDEDVYTDSELTEEESPAAPADEGLPFSVSEEDTYSADELSDGDDPFFADDTDGDDPFFADDTDGDALDVLFEEITDGLPSPDAPLQESDDEDAALLKELHDVFVHNIDARRKELDKDKKDESAVDDLLKALAEAIEDPAADTDGDLSDSSFDDI